MNLEYILRNPPFLKIKTSYGEVEDVDYDKWKQQIQELMLGEEEIKRVLYKFRTKGIQNDKINLAPFISKADFSDLAKAISSKMKDKLK